MSDIEKEPRDQGLAHVTLPLEISTTLPPLRDFVVWDVFESLPRQLFFFSSKTKSCPGCSLLVTLPCLSTSLPRCVTRTGRMGHQVTVSVVCMHMDPHYSFFLQDTLFTRHLCVSLKFIDLMCILAMCVCVCVCNTEQCQCGTERMEHVSNISSSRGATLGSRCAYVPRQDSIIPNFIHIRDIQQQATLGSRCALHDCGWLSNCARTPQV